MSTEAASHESFNIERHGEIAVVTPSAKVEEMHETMIEQAARMVIQSLKSDPPAGIVVDLSQVTYFGSVFVSFLLRCHSPARKRGSGSNDIRSDVLAELGELHAGRKKIQPTRSQVRDFLVDSEPLLDHARLS